jgi:L-lactate dehydrogenase complex protein LldF
VYREIGGHSYGPTAYSGPIGAVVTPLLADDMATVKELPYASSLCGACRDVCPAKIDLPRLLLDLRHQLVEQGTTSHAERIAIRGFTAAARKPGRFVTWSRVGRWITGLLAGKDGDVAKLPPPLNAWTRSRVFPKLARRSFRALWSRRSSKRSVQ